MDKGLCNGAERNAHLVSDNAAEQNDGGGDDDGADGGGSVNADVGRASRDIPLDGWRRDKGIDYRAAEAASALKEDIDWGRRNGIQVDAADDSISSGGAGGTEVDEL
jgi:hypothetical protein